MFHFCWMPGQWCHVQMHTNTLKKKKKKSSTTRMTNVSQHHQTNVWSCFHCPKTNKKNVPFGGSRLFSVNTDKIKLLQFCSDNWLGLVKKREAAKEQMEDWVRSDESAEWVSVQKCGPSAPGAKRKCLDWDWTRMSFSKNCFGKMRNLIRRTEQRGSTRRVRTWFEKRDNRRGRTSAVKKVRS